MPLCAKFPKKTIQKMKDVILLIAILKEECPTKYNVPFNVILSIIADYFCINLVAERILSLGELNYARAKAKFHDLRPCSYNRNPLGSMRGLSAYYLSIISSYLEENCPPSCENQNTSGMYHLKHHTFSVLSLFYQLVLDPSYSLDLQS